MRNVDAPRYQPVRGSRVAGNPTPRRQPLVFPRHEPEGLVRGAQRVALLEPHGEEPIDSREHCRTGGRRETRFHFITHRGPRFEPVRRKDRHPESVIDNRRSGARVKCTFVAYLPLADGRVARGIVAQVSAVAADEERELQEPLRPQSWLPRALLLSCRPTSETEF